MRKVLSITQVPSRNPKLPLSMRQSVKLCQLLGRPGVTYWYIESYVRALSCADYSGAQV